MTVFIFFVDRTLIPRLELLDCFGQRRDDVEEVADDAVVGHVEDGRFGVFVDGDDVLRRDPVPYRRRIKSYSVWSGKG